MTPPVGWVLCAFEHAILGSASLLVPLEQRAEWLREWRSELWHVRQTCAQMGATSWPAEREATAFCLGAFQDALYLRKQAGQRRAAFASLHGSAVQCLVVLAAVLVACYAMALFSPGVRAERSLKQVQISPGLVMIQDLDDYDDALPSISSRQYRTWKERKQEYFDEFAFYRVTRELVSTGSQASVGWGVARASLNLFTLLGLPVQFAETDGKAGDDAPRVILSEEAWKRKFGATRHIAGRMVRVGQRQARIVGVAPDGSWGLPGKVDAWLLEPDSKIAAGGAGYVVAHLSASGKAMMWAARMPITAVKANRTEDDLLGVSLEGGTPGPRAVYLFAVFLALLALPAMTSVSLGEYSVYSQKPLWSTKLRRWGFLSAKIALLLPIVYLGSLDLAYGYTPLGSNRSLYVQLIASFSICLWGMRWVLKDQRQRCPVCLRRVQHPAQVGQASRTFLAWNGTEQMCTGGHTLLYVPGIPTSWYSTQCWLYLDTSWAFLFSGPGAGIESGAMTR